MRKISIGDWGWGMGDGGLGIGPNPQSPIPNPQSPFHSKNINKLKFFKILLFLNHIFNLINNNNN